MAILSYSRSLRSKKAQLLNKKSQLQSKKLATPFVPQIDPSISFVPLRPIQIVTVDGSVGFQSGNEAFFADSKKSRDGGKQSFTDGS
jgi:hypothetical protein